MRNLPIEVSIDEIQDDHKTGSAENICELRKSSLVLYGIFTDLLRLVYRDPEGRLVGTPDVIWHPEFSEKMTDIWIDSELRWEDEHPEKRPAIYVQLGQIQMKSPFPGNNGRIKAADRFGEREYAYTATGSVTFVHIGHTSGEACALADNTEYELSSLQDPICRDFCFKQFALAGRVPLEKSAKESSERRMSAVTFQFEFDEIWKVKEECPILKAIDFLPHEDRDSRQTTVIRDNISTDKKRLEDGQA